MMKPQDVPYGDLLFAALDIPMPDVNDWKKRIVETDSTFWFYDTYRTVQILPLRTASGGTTFQQTQNTMRADTFKWTAAAFTDLVSYFEKYVFPWTTDKCRIAVLRTPPGGVSKTHIDCAPAAMGTLQHKFRLVVSGSTSSLFYETANGRVWAPDVKQPFLMDGSWPHGLINSSSEDKITVCLGAPFNYSSQYPRLLNYVSSSDYEAPGITPEMFEDKFFTS